MHHLFGEALAHLVLVLAAVLEEGGESLVSGESEEALFGEEEAQGGAEWAPSRPAHVGDAEVHPAGAFSARGGDEAKRDPVEEQAGGNPGAAEKALGAAVWRGFEARPCAGASTPGRRVEVLPRVQHLDEKLPRRLSVPRVALADCEVGAKGLAVVREGNLQISRNRSFLRAGVPAGREAPAENGAGKLAEVGDVELRPARRVELALADAAGKPALPFGVLAVQDGSRLRERRGGDHEALRLDEPEPFEVGAGVGVGGGHVAVAGLSVPRRTAEVLHAEQSLVRWTEVLAIPRRVDLPRRAGDDVPVPEVIHQQFVIRVEQTGATRDREGQDVAVVGFADIPPPEILRALLDGFVRNGARPTILNRVSKPLYEPVVSAQLVPKFAANDQLPARTCEPVEESFASRGGFIAEHFVGHVGIDDSAHQRPTERRVSSMKNCPYPSGAPRTLP